jgi:hypothetical protein
MSNSSATSATSSSSVKSQPIPIVKKGIPMGRGYFNGPREENHPAFYKTYLKLKEKQPQTAEMLYGDSVRNYLTSRNVMMGKMRRRKSQRKFKKVARKTRRA